MYIDVQRSVSSHKNTINNETMVTISNALEGVSKPSACLLGNKLPVCGIIIFWANAHVLNVCS